MTQKLNNGAIRKRWMENRNRRQEDPGYQDEWRTQQCLHCVYYVPIDGALGDDFGVCANSDSLFDGRVMFEHDGCEHHQHIEDVM